MQGNRTRTPVGWRQLCAIAREALEADPMIDNGEWVESIKRRILALGYTYPEGLDAIHRAIRAVERTTSRPLPTPPGARVEVESSAPPPLSHAEAKAIYDELGVRARTIAGTPRATTAEQVEAWRREQPRPQYRKTARGWVKLCD